MSEASPSAARRCCLCDRGLIGHVLSDPRGHWFCREHLPAISLCRYCQCAFLDTQRRDVCKSCRARAITNTEDARKLVAIGPLSWFEAHGLSAGPSARQLTLSQSMPRHHNGREIWGYVRRDAERAVVIKHGLPRPVFMLVAAHELGHLWLAQSNARLPDRIEEGLCDWLAYRFGRSLSDPECDWLARMIAKRADTGCDSAFREVRLHLDDAAPSDLPALLPTFRRRVLN